MNTLRKVVIKIYNLLTGFKNPVLYRSLFFVLFISPVISLAIMNYRDLEQDATNAILMQRRSLSILAAANIRENLDNVVNLGISYATRPRVVEYIERGDWKGAMSIMARALEFFPYFDRIVLFDPKGLIKADMPHAIPTVIGESRADREWYKGVKRNWEPYISGIYIRGAEPRMPVVSVIVPIKTVSAMTKKSRLAERGDQKVIGILQFQIKLEIFNRWIDNVEIGAGSILYIVDQYGRLVHHPRYGKERILIDFSSVGIVGKALNGIGGSELNYNPIEKEERLAAYEPVTSYGWGVVITQPTVFAYIEKNKRQQHAIFTYSIIAFLTGVMALLILYSIVIHKKIESEKEKLISELKEALDNIKILKGLLPICSSCKKIRNDEGYWEQMEVYIRDHSEAEFTHGICPACMQKLYPEIYERTLKTKKGG